MKKVFISLFLLTGYFGLRAQLRTANIFTDHMVLQRNMPINIWGRATAKEKVTLQFHNQVKEVTTDKTGKWLATLSSEAAGGPYQLTITGKKEKVEITDILVGDVWICSGQSNMEWVLKSANNAKKEIAAAGNSLIRHVKIERQISAGALDDIAKTNWEVCTPETAGQFTAVGYYFAQSLTKDLNIPVGLINSSWGGTIVESWISKTGLETDTEFEKIANELPESREQFEKVQLQRLKKDISVFQQNGEEEIAEGWEKSEFDDKAWSSLDVPKIWEDQGLPVFDGIVWYRHDFVLTKQQAAADIILHLGMIDDCDDTYINGIKVGNNCDWQAKRVYVISKALLKEGRNVIAVKVSDGGGGGGFHGEASEVKIEAAGADIPLAGKWKARVDIKSSLVSSNPNSMPALLYNAMIHPLINCAVKGVIWYQGESNTERAYQYNRSFPLLIRDWRSKFKQPLLPFYFVQLASFNANNENGPDGSQWAELRDAQLQTAKLPHTGMAITSDIGNNSDIHPTNKKDVGYRLALQVLAKEYGKNKVADGPLYKSMRIDRSRIIIQFDGTGSGLAVANKYGYLTGFMIAGKDQQFHWAKASIENDEVIVWCDAVAEPVAVRYAWIDESSEGNLRNLEGLPASPFRTDNWNLITQDIKYIIGK